ncbi:MAG: efflux RND transporter permease subunit, partial [Desulfomonilia bacterium]|nr:efflux RND transporter permease subunit [Desulfomonilia bacterium]
MNKALEWFAQNSVAANLILILVLAAGIMSVSTIRQEVFPELPSDLITVSVLYPGAAPEEVEEGVCIRIEEEVQSLEGIKRIRSRASEGRGTVSIEVLPGTDVKAMLDDVKARIDAIETFPEEAEKPDVQEALNRLQVINIALSGEADEKTLRVLSDQIREDILKLEGITQAQVSSVRPYEISVEISETALLRYGLTFDEVVQAIRRSSLDLPGGAIKAEGGEVLLRTKGQAYSGGDFENIILRTRPDGTRILLGDVAQVVDGFAETDQSARFDGEPAALIQVFRVGNEDAINVASQVRAYVDQHQQRMPEGLKLTIWNDDSMVLKSRIDLLMRNGRSGLILVFITLALFLRFRLAFWVALGVPFSFLGVLWLMPYFDVSVNMISTFAFILVIGILVDDAIVVGESINTEIESGKSRIQAAIDGVKRVAVPVVFAVLTTVAAFWPMLTVEGVIGKVMRLIPIIVILALMFSLIESLFILPAHLSHMGSGNPGSGRSIPARWARFQKKFNSLFQGVIDRAYRPSLELGLRIRYVTASFGIALLILTLGMVAGGWVKFVFFPKIDADNVVAELTLPLGTPVEVTRQAVMRLEETARALETEFGEDRRVLRHILVSVGEQPGRNEARGPVAGQALFVGSHLGEVNIELVPSENRTM